MPFNVMEIPFSIYDIETGLNEPWKVVFVKDALFSGNIPWVYVPNISEAATQIPTRASLKMNGLSPIEMEFDADSFSYLIPNIKMTFVDPIKSGNHIPLLLFLTHPDYGSVTHAYFFKDDVFQYVFKVIRNSIKLSGFELQIDLAISLNSTSETGVFESILSYLQGIGDGTASLEEIFLEVFKYITGDASHTITSKPSITTYLFNGHGAWSDLMLTADNISVTEPDYIYWSMKDWLTNFAKSLQLFYGVDEKNRSFIRFKIDFESVESIPDSEIIEDSLNFETVDIKDGVYVNKLQGDPIVLDEPYSKGHVVSVEKPDGEVIIHNSGSVIRYDHPLRLDAFRMFSDPETLDEVITTVSVLESDDSYTEYAASSQFIGEIEYRFQQKIFGYGSIGLKGLNRHIYKTYQFNYVYLNGGYIPLILAPMKISKDYMGQSTTLTGYFFLQTALQKPINQPTGLIFSAVDDDSITIDFDPSIANDFLILMKDGSSPTGAPADGVVYSIGNAIGDGIVVGFGHPITVNSLSEQINHHFKIFAFNSHGSARKYLVESPLSGNKYTLADEPTNSATSLNITRGLNNLALDWTAPGGNANGVMILRHLSTAVTDSPVDGVVYSSGYVFAGGAVVIYLGSGTSFDDTGLSEDTTYHYSIVPYRGSGSGVINYKQSSTLTGSDITAVTEPSQASALTLDSYVSNGYLSSLSLSWNKNGAARTIIMAKDGSPPTGVPSDNNSYSAGATIGDSIVAYDGESSSFTHASLDATTTYFYKAYTYNGSSGSNADYNTVSPPQGNWSPSSGGSEPSGMSYFDITPDIHPLVSDRMTLEWTIPGDADGVVIRATSRSGGFATDPAPVDGTNYGSDLNHGADTGIFNLYSGSGSSCTHNGGTGVDFYYRIYAYKITNGVKNYNQNGYLELYGDPEADGDFQVPADQPTDINFTGVDADSITVNFTASEADEFLVLYKAGSVPTGSPTNNVIYAVDDAIGDGYVFGIGGASFFTKNSLADMTQFHFNIFALNKLGSSRLYKTSGPLQGNVSTDTDEPANSATGLNITRGINNLSLEWTAPGGNATGVIILRHLSTAVTDEPVDLTSYSNGQTLSNGAVVIYQGNGTTFNDTGLSSDTLYHYAIFSVRGTRYKQSSPLTGSNVTNASEPTQASALTLDSHTGSSLSLSWNKNGADRVIVMFKDGAVPTGVPTDFNSYSASDTIGDSTVAYVGTANSFTHSSLSSATTYFYKVYTFNGDGTTSNYNTTSPAQGNWSPSSGGSEPSAMTSFAITIDMAPEVTDSMDLEWVYPGDADGVVIMGTSRVGGFLTDPAPTDGSNYTNDLNHGADTGNFALYSGSGTSCTHNGGNHVAFTYRIYAYKTTGGVKNYNQLGYIEIYGDPDNDGA